MCPLTPCIVSFSLSTVSRGKDKLENSDARHTLQRQGVMFPGLVPAV